MANKFKYPRTPHFPWSPGATNDDRILKDTSNFEGKSVVITEKMDGENTTLYQEDFHARSLEYAYHVSQSYVKQLHGNIKHDIPVGWRICGENLYAKHSIKYSDLVSYFQVFSIWNDNNVCLSWDDTVDWCKLLGLHHVRVIYKGTYDEDYIKTIPIKSSMEGYVVRLSTSFSYGNFGKSIAK